MSYLITQSKYGQIEQVHRADSFEAAQDYVHRVVTTACGLPMQTWNDMSSDETFYGFLTKKGMSQVARGEHICKFYLGNTNKACNTTTLQIISLQDVSEVSQ